MGQRGKGRDDDRRHGDRRGADRQRRRHGVRPARRPALPAVRRPAAARREHPHHRRAARAGLRLHGLRLRALHRPAGRLRRRARAGRAQHRGGLVHGVWLLRAGAVHHRPGALGLPRSRPRASARAARSARHPALADQMGGADRAPGRRAAIVNEAFRQMLSGRPGPVAVEMAWDTMAASALRRAARPGRDTRSRPRRHRWRWRPPPSCSPPPGGR